ncbi:hypothetical protein EVAR_18074_1 [Eumeta japonica]|uniref:Uncharacterized protein n=1 Tax=Eumeta variegata TaxID=151549 RepID=A0A4C1VKE4_EUMVA|nr:hypothetical protein EVAR_18074_1 [Eumeta japonica]
MAAIVELLANFSSQSRGDGRFTSDHCWQAIVELLSEFCIRESSSGRSGRIVLSVSYTFTWRSPLNHTSVSPPYDEGGREDPTRLRNPHPVHVRACDVTLGSFGVGQRRYSIAMRYF